MDLDVFGVFSCYKASLELTTEPPIKSGDKIRGVFHCKAKKDIEEVSFTIRIRCKWLRWSVRIWWFEEYIVDKIPKEILVFESIASWDFRSDEFMLPFKDLFTKKRYKEYKKRMKKEFPDSWDEEECDEEFSSLQWVVQLLDREKLKPLQTIPLEGERKFILP